MVSSLPATIILTIANYQSFLTSGPILKSLPSETSLQSMDPSTLLDHIDLGPNQIAGLRLTLILSVIGFWLVLFTGAAAASALRKQMRGEDLELTDVLGFQGRGVATFGVSGAMTFLITLGYLCCYFPGIAAEGYSLSAALRCVDRRCTFSDAFSKSFLAAKSQVMTVGMKVHALLLILFVASLLPFFGFLVGVPLYNICRALLYLRMNQNER